MEIEAAEKSDLIPWISIGLVLLAGFVSGFSYNAIREGAVLLFYAVLVSIWTSMGSEMHQTTSEIGYIEFLVSAAGAVIVGQIIELGVRSISGEIIAAQSLALAILISRFYVNSKSGQGTRELIGLDDPVDRYIILVPCLFVLLFPVVLHQLDVSPILGFDLESLTRPTQDAFMTLIVVAIMCGVLVYGRIEEGWSVS